MSPHPGRKRPYHVYLLSPRTMARGLIDFSWRDKEQFCMLCVCVCVTSRVACVVSPIDFWVSHQVTSPNHTQTWRFKAKNGPPNLWHGLKTCIDEMSNDCLSVYFCRHVSIIPGLALYNEHCKQILRPQKNPIRIQGTHLVGERHKTPFQFWIFRTIPPFPVGIIGEGQHLCLESAFHVTSMNVRHWKWIDIDDNGFQGARLTGYELSLLVVNTWEDWMEGRRVLIWDRHYSEQLVCR